MRFINLVALSSVIAFATACGGNSSKDKTTTDTTGTTVSTTPTTTTGMDPVPSTTFNAPEPVVTSFREKYPNTQRATWSRYQPTNTIDWEWTGWPSMDTADYAVNFNMDNSDYWAWYDNENNWVGSVTTVSDYKSLPAAVSKSIDKEFKGYTITGVDKEIDRKRTAYEIDLEQGGNKARLLVAEDGSVIKKKTESADGDRTKEKAPK